MATYECNKCGKSVNARCGKCDTKLLNDTLEIENDLVQILKCPNWLGKLNHLYVVDKTWHALYRILNFLISEILGFLFFGIIIISIIVIVVNFVNKNHNKTIIKEKKSDW